MIILAIFVAILVLGVGYAAVSNVNLVIEGDATAANYDLNVHFIDETSVDVTNANYLNKVAGTPDVVATAEDKALTAIIQKPILLVENKNRDSSFFMIPSNDNLLYNYSIKIKDIQKELKETQG